MKAGHEQAAGSSNHGLQKWVSVLRRAHGCFSVRSGRRRLSRRSEAGEDQVPETSCCRPCKGLTIGHDFSVVNPDRSSGLINYVCSPSVAISN